MSLLAPHCNIETGTRDTRRRISSKFEIKWPIPSSLSITATEFCCFLSPSCVHHAMGLTSNLLVESWLCVAIVVLALFIGVLPVASNSNGVFDCFLFCKMLRRVLVESNHKESTHWLLFLFHHGSFSPSSTMKTMLPPRTAMGPQCRSENRGE